MVFDAKAYGALGDGVADDTAAIQAAIDAAFTAGGGVVYLPEGVYRISGDGTGAGNCLTMHSQVDMIGAGMGSTVLKLVDGSALPLLGMIGSPTGEVLQGVGISDLSLDGNRGNSSGEVNGWHLAASTAGISGNLSIERVEVRDVSGSGFRVDGQTSHLLIKESVAHGNGQDGFVSRDSNSGYYADNQAYGNDGNGFALDTHHSALTFTNNDAFANGANGLLVTGDADTQPDSPLLILGGELQDNGQAGIALQQASEVRVEGALIGGNGGPGILLSGASHNQIIANQLQGNAQSGPGPEILVEADASGGITVVSSHNLIEQNLISGGPGSTYGVLEVADGSHATGVYANQIEAMLSGQALLHAADSRLSSDPSHELLVQVVGSEDRDRLAGGEADERLLGLDGNDSLAGGAGNDVLVGGAGRDTLTGGSGADIFRYAASADSYRTGSGAFSDHIVDFDAALDRIDLSELGFSALGNGLDGTLRLSYSSASDRTYLSSLASDAEGRYFELAIQGNHLSTLSSANILFNGNVAPNAAPVLHEALPNQTITENQVFTFGFSASNFSDPDGDTLSYKATLGNSTALPSWLRFDAATLSFNGLPGLGNAGIYEIKVSAGDGRGGSLANSFLLVVDEAPAGTPTLHGSAGNDLLLGTSANETLLGLGGADTLMGGAGHDMLVGGLGRDTLTGGDGVDTFRFDTLHDSYRNGSPSCDLITDFDPTTDRIDLSALGFSGLGNGLNGTLALSYSAASDRTYLRSLETDANGDRFELALQGNHLDTLNGSNLFLVTPPPPPPGTITPPPPTPVGTPGDDVLNGTDASELLLGHAGADKINGGGGNDIIDGGAGKDVLTGDDGADVFRFTELLDSFRNYGPANISAADTITDFTVGVDKIDLSALGITGLDDGYNHSVYLTLNETGTKTSIKSREPDADGNTFELALNGNHIGTLSEADFIFADPTPQTTLFIPTLGQSNSRALRMQGEDDDSGITEMIKQLKLYTDFDRVESLFSDAAGEPIDIAVGGSTVTGSSTASEAERAKSWWYSDTDQPGQALLNAVANLGSQLAALQAQGPVTFAMVWGQGEDDAMTYAAASDKTAAIELYKANTLKVFDYLKAQLGTPDAVFYVMLTGDYQQQGADLRGFTSEEIAEVVDGTQAIRQAQMEMAAGRSDIKIAVDYTDLPMRYEVDPLTYYYDVWHMHDDASEIIGQRLADFIANDLGYTSNPGDNNDPDAISMYPANKVVGGHGIDQLTGTPLADTLEGDEGANYMAGYEGSDVYVVNNPGDILFENGTGAEDHDTVVSSINWVLGDNLENLLLTGQARNGTGNSLANIIGGNDGDNVLDGGTGVDVLLGGKGSDTYFVDDAADRAMEGSNAGFDRVFSTASTYTLSYNLEELYLVAPGNSNGTGNAQDNTIYASSGNNVINGGDGVDTLSYAFAEAGVTVRLTTSAAQNTGGSGFDSLRHLENLIGSNHADNLTGDANDNILRGGAGNDVLNGGGGDDVLDGGSGADQLNGGAGADRYVFTSLSDLGLGDLADLISGFNGGEGDCIDFSALDANPLTAAREAFEFIGNQDFSATNATGQLRFADGALYGSINADSAAEFTIRLLGVTEFSQNDLLG
ncbi:glycosyl hydrolase family 28-related protein [Pseudomonas sp. SO81]|uniref:M10 family metallopeptidase C-terminal domain-containing protein n=1 Tax=Pseudomonas sp. SO81 TaxID=2983246 RepID=UPI0025A35A5A|nr:glycosyl hydrolase family 28-related protein [Pseudomonas sp. SO81]WJN60294.1 Large exo [Pseudomonas sp. SO81]